MSNETVPAPSAPVAPEPDAAPQFTAEWDEARSSIQLREWGEQWVTVPVNDYRGRAFVDYLAALAVGVPSTPQAPDGWSVEGRDCATPMANEEAARSYLASRPVCSDGTEHYIVLRPAPSTSDEVGA